MLYAFPADRHPHARKVSLHKPYAPHGNDNVYEDELHMRRERARHTARLTANDPHALQAWFAS